MLGRSPVIDRLALFALALYVLSVGLVWQKRSGAATLAQDTPPQIEQPTPPKKLSGPVRITFDIEKVEKEPASVYSACGIPTPSEGLPAPWKKWVAFEGKRLKSTSTESDVPAFAVRTPEGAALCVTNHTDGLADVRVNARLLRGVYTIERIVLEPENGAQVLGVERLQGTLLDKAATVRKVGAVPAHAIAVYRFVNRSQQALSAFRGAQHRIKGFKAGNGAQYGWLMVPFSECGSNIAIVARGIRSDNRYDVLKHVHRAILTTAHTQALCRNFTGQGRIDKETGDSLATKLDLLDEALSELSVACLGLAPETVMHPVSSSGACKVTVSVTNSGSRTINFVKIGALGEGALKVSPNEFATFGSVRPGEAARATFDVQWGKPEQLGKLAAHFGYLSGKLPVRVRLRPAI